MKLGIMTSIFRGKPYEAMLDTAAAAGLDAVEIDTGGYGWVPDWVNLDDLPGIEREDALASPEEGFRRAVTFPRACLLYKEESSVLIHSRPSRRRRTLWPWA